MGSFLGGLFKRLDTMRNGQYETPVNSAPPLTLARLAEAAPPARTPSEWAQTSRLTPPDTPEAPELWKRKDKPLLAVRRAAGAQPGVVNLQGLASDMEGTKATFVEYMARRNGRACLRQDYRGLGASEGDYLNGTLGDWLEDARDCLDAFTEGPQILVGSSMGGWLATLLALQRPSRVAGVLMLAPALDFTSQLLKPRLTDEARRDLERQGFYERHPGLTVSKALLDEGENWLVLCGEKIPMPFPVRIIQGMRDESVPWEHAVRTAEAIESPDLRLERLQDAAHRLSRAQDLMRIAACLDELCLLTR